MKKKKTESKENACCTVSIACLASGCGYCLIGLVARDTLSEVTAYIMRNVILYCILNLNYVNGWSRHSLCVLANPSTGAA